MLLLWVACTSSKQMDTGDDKEWGEPVSLIDYVDPMIATGGIGYAVNCGYPGANVPLGMVYNKSALTLDSPAITVAYGYKVAAKL